MALGIVNAPGATGASAQETANTAQETATAAQTAANTAQETASAAQSTANTAKSTADTALSTANSAKSTADEALRKVNEVQSNTLTLDKTSVTLSLSNLTDTVTVTSGTATIVTSANTDIAEASLSGNAITITGKKKGTTVIMVNSVTVINVINNLPTELSECTPAEIQKAAQLGIASSLWNVGDKVGIKLSGTVGEITLNDTYYAYIIGFDHNADIEGSNCIHFLFGKTVDDKDIAFCDSSYNSYDTVSTNKFKMNTQNTNTGGWKSSTMRTERCAEFLNTMPTAWQNVIAACTKYSDNTGGGSNTSSYVTSTSDKIWLLSEYEVFGGISYANSAEAGYQAQYIYFANGNDRRKHHHSTGNACHWWLRSVYAANTAHFCTVGTDGSANHINAYHSYGFAPGFKVA